MPAIAASLMFIDSTPIPLSTNSPSLKLRQGLFRGNDAGVCTQVGRKFHQADTLYFQEREVMTNEAHNLVVIESLTTPCRSWHPIHPTQKPIAKLPGGVLTATHSAKFCPNGLQQQRNSFLVGHGSDNATILANLVC